MACMDGGDDFNRSIITVETIEPPAPENVPPPSPKHQESLLVWFDKNCEKELQRRRYDKIPKLDISGQQGLAHLVESTASGIDVQCRLRSEQDTDLLDAVEKFAKAEAMVAFEGAVRAAEYAAASVPPEYAEEAAVAGARSFQAELTSVVKETVPGVRPIEVVGYVGITRPRKPKRSAQARRT